MINRNQWNIFKLRLYKKRSIATNTISDGNKPITNCYVTLNELFFIASTRKLYRFALNRMRK